MACPRSHCLIRGIAAVSRVTVLPHRTHHHPFPSAISATRIGYCISVPCGRQHSVGTPAVPSLVSTGEVYLGALKVTPFCPVIGWLQGGSLGQHRAGRTCLLGLDPLLPSPGPQTLPLLCGWRCAVHSLGRGQHPLLTPIPQDRSPVVLPQQPQQFLTHSWIVSTSYKYRTISLFSCLKSRLQTKNTLLPHFSPVPALYLFLFPENFLSCLHALLFPSLQKGEGHCPHAAEPLLSPILNLLSAAPGSPSSASPGPCFRPSRLLLCLHCWSPHLPSPPRAPSLFTSTPPLLSLLASPPP